MYKTWVALIMSLLAGACSLFGYGLQRPTLAVVDIKMLSANFFQQEFVVRLKIKNPNDRDLPVESISALLRVEGEDFASGSTDRAFRVPAQGEAEFEMTVEANMAVGFLKWAKKHDKSQSSVGYTLIGSVSIDRPLLHSIPFQQTGVFSLQSR